MFANMKIGSRLGMAFGAVILLLVIVVGMAVASIASLRGAVDELGLRSIPKVEILNKWVVAVLQSARHMRNALLIPEKDKIAEELAAIRAEQAERTEYMNKLEPMITRE